jgi:hypothetical protein
VTTQTMVRVRVVPKANRFQFHMVDECNGSKLGFSVAIRCLLWLLSETHGRCMYRYEYNMLLYFVCYFTLSFTGLGFGLWF